MRVLLQLGAAAGQVGAFFMENEEPADPEEKGGAAVADGPLLSDARSLPFPLLPVVATYEHSLLGAGREGDMAALRQLLSDENLTPLLLDDAVVAAARAGRSAAVQLLLSDKLASVKRGIKALKAAASGQHVDLVRLLMTSNLCGQATLAMRFPGFGSLRGLFSGRRVAVLAFFEDFRWSVPKPAEDTMRAAGMFTD